jgi:hypothetical protein
MAQIVILGFCFILCLLFSTSANAQPTNNYFNVYPTTDIYADSARFYLTYFHAQIAKILGKSLDTTVTLFLASNEKEFQNDIGDIVSPDWGAGLALLEQAKIVLKSPKYMPVNKPFRELIGHELAHIMLYRASGGRWLPRWIQEGFAMNVSGEWHIGLDISVAKAAWTGNLLALPQIENLSNFKSARVDLAYSESYLAVSRLIRQSDPYVLSDLLEMYRKSGDFYGSWKTVFGQDYLTWISNWLASISRQYHFFVFIIDSQMFWIGLVVLFVLLFIYKKRQNAKTKKRWEREERLNPPDDDYKEYFDGYYDEENKT